MNVEEVIRDKHFGDKEQLDFIFSDSNRIIVTAPAGCGKTTAMVSKIARELCLGHIQGNKKVLAMTFSVNAAIRIKDSVKNLLPDIIDNPKVLLNKIDIANYHNFAMRILYKYGYILNDKFSDLSDFEIIDDNEAKRKNILISTEEYEFGQLEIALKHADYEELSETIDLYWDILNRKFINRKIITYNGILVSAIKLLANNNIARFYSRYYQMIIIDEFQDTNLLGYLLIDKLIGNNTVVFLGDDIQKIYGFLGAIDNILGTVAEKYGAEEFVFKTNYRFKNNERMKNLDLFIREYAENYRPSSLTASTLLKQLETDSEEVEFICDGIETVLSNGCDVAVLVRAGWQGNIIVSELENRGVSFFNALFTDKDVEFLNFYRIAVEEFHKNVSGKAVQSALNKCLNAVKKREEEIYSDEKRKFVFDALFILLKKLFEISKTWDGTSKERFARIDFILVNKGLKQMMEYLEEKVVLTTIHASKGLEWDYIIIPQLNASSFPAWKYVCQPCQGLYGCNSGYDFCENRFVPEMEKSIKEELSVFYVALTRAKKDVFLTVNTGVDKNHYVKKTSCLINLPGLNNQDFEWVDVL